MLKDSEVEISENLSYVEEPMKIVDHKVKQLRNREIPMVKVGWKNHRVKEATWEIEEKMKRDYPQLFDDPGKLILLTKFFLEGKNCNVPDLETLGLVCMHIYIDQTLS